MKYLLGYLVIFLPILSTAQTKHKPENKKDAIAVVSATPVMDSDFRQGFKVLIHNGSNKKIVALKLTFDFNNKSTKNDFGSQQECYVFVNLKVNISRNSTKSYNVKNLYSNINCDNKPEEVTIKTVVFSDGTFDERIFGSIGTVDKVN